MIPWVPEAVVAPPRAAAAEGRGAAHGVQQCAIARAGGTGGVELLQAQDDQGLAMPVSLGRVESSLTLEPMAVRIVCMPPRGPALALAARGLRSGSRYFRTHLRKVLYATIVTSAPMPGPTASPSF